MDAAEELVDGLDHRALARALADVEELVAERREQRPRRREHVVSRRRHDGERAAGRADDPARHRRVDEAAPGRLDLLADLRRVGGRAGRHQDHDRGGFERRKRAAVEEHGARLGGVDDHEHEGIGVPRRRGGAVGAGTAGRGKRIERRGLEVEAAHREAGRDEPQRHGQPHGAEPDKADLLHGLIL
jgi:hypothetical protein